MSSSFDLATHAKDAGKSMYVFRNADFSLIVTLFNYNRSLSFECKKIDNNKYQINVDNHEIIIDISQRILYFCKKYQFELNAKYFNIYFDRVQTKGIIEIKSNFRNENKYYQLDLNSCKLTEIDKS